MLNADSPYRKIILIVMLLTFGSLWGLNTTVAKFGADDGMHAFSMTFWQSVVAAIGLGIGGVLSGERITLDRRLIAVCFLSGAIGMAFPNVLLYSAVSHVSVGIISIVLLLNPPVTLIFATLIRIDYFSPKRLVGILLGFFSALIIIVPSMSGSIDAPVIWLLVILLAPFGYAFMNIALGHYLADNDTPLLLASGLFVSVALCSGSLIAFNPSTFTLIYPPFGTGEIASVLLGVFVCIAHGLYVNVIKYAGAVFASLGTYVVTIAGVLWGIAILGESHSYWIWSSLIFMLISVYLVQTKKEA